MGAVKNASAHTHDTPQEIAFCSVAEKKVDKFPAGSMLEYIPLGSIHHLMSPISKATAISVGQINELDKYIEEIASSGGRPLAVVFYLRNIENLVKKEGTAVVNESIAGLFEAVRQSFQSPAKICQLETNKVAVATKIGKTSDANKLVQSAIRLAARKASHLVSFAAGAYAKESENSEERIKLEGDESVLNSKTALTFARYAALSTEHKTKSIELFSPATAVEILSFNRQRRAFKEALADYYTLSELGVAYGDFENQAALVTMELDNRDLALECIERALALSPGEEIFMANLGYIRFVRFEYLQATEAFQKLRSQNPKWQWPLVYVLPEVLSAYRAYTADNNAVKPETVISRLREALTIKELGDKRRIQLETTLSDMERRFNSANAKVTDSNLESLWVKLVEAVGRTSPFARSYLIDGKPVSFEGEILTIGFDPEFGDHVTLIDNARNQNLITGKLRELGCEAKAIKFIVLQKTN
jgi:tetratricopeptide (TPR) repeat protein